MRAWHCELPGRYPSRAENPDKPESGSETPIRLPVRLGTKVVNTSMSFSVRRRADDFRFKTRKRTVGLRFAGTLAV